MTTLRRAPWILGAEALERVGTFGVPVPRTWRVASVQDAVEHAGALGGPVVVKIDHPSLLHKSDAAGVCIGVVPEDVAAVCRTLRQSLEERGTAFDPDGGFLVQELVPAGTEVLVGVSTDPTFGRVMSVGVGGTLVELLDRVACRALPLEEHDVWDALDETQLLRLLEGHREGPRDTRALVQTVLAFQAFVLAHRGVVEAELNPVIVRARGEGCVAVDARFRETGDGDEPTPSALRVHDAMPRGTLEVEK